MSLWTEDTERRADMAHWLGYGRWAGPQGDARWRAMGLRHVLYLCETAAGLAWDGEASWPPRAVLDYGCGGGSTLRALAAIPTVPLGVDVSYASRAEASAAGFAGLGFPVTWSPEDWREDAEGAGPIDAAICTHVLQHVTPTEAHGILSTLRAALKPGGVLLVTTRRPVNGAAPDDVCTLTTWTEAEARSALDRHGFRVVKHWAESNGSDYWGVERVG